MCGRHYGIAPSGCRTLFVDYCGTMYLPAMLIREQRRCTKQDQFDDLTSRLGSIHSVKGKSVDVFFVVESEVLNGSSAGEQCVDLAAVLPRAFGVTDELFTGVRLTAATKVFVGVKEPHFALKGGTAITCSRLRLRSR